MDHDWATSQVGYYDLYILVIAVGVQEAATLRPSTDPSASRIRRMMLS